MSALELVISRLEGQVTAGIIVFEAGLSVDLLLSLRRPQAPSSSTRVEQRHGGLQTF